MLVEKGQSGRLRKERILPVHLLPLTDDRD